MIVIDGIIFALQKHGGISVYFRSLFDYLSKIEVENNLIVYDLKNIIGVLDNKSTALSFQKSRIFERYRDCRVSRKEAVFHSSYYRKPDNSNIPTVVTVHDFTYERYQHGLRRWVHTSQKNASIRAAQEVICISESTKQDLLEFVGETPGQTIHVIHNGVSDIFRNLCLAPAVSPYVLFVGQRDGYKNFHLALKALELLPELELKCVGGGEIRPYEMKGVPESVARRVQHLGFVPDDELNVLYNQALCLLYPSSYEGFGIPVIEAMRAGCPVVSADCKAVMEVGRDALTVFTGSDPQVVADAILKTASSERSSLVQKGQTVASVYSWDTTHRKTLEVYRRLGAIL
jgi:mannosyltransferase